MGGEGENGEWAYVHFTGPDAYELTVITAVAGALTLVEEIDDLKSRAGVLTPAYAFHGSTWVDRIQERGFASTGHSRMKWTVHDGKPPESKLNTAIQKKTRRFSEGQERIRRGELKAFEPPLLPMLCSGG